jgi:hypothetical protein
MGWEAAVGIWMVAGPLLLLGFLLRFPFIFPMTFIAAFVLSFLLGRTLTGSRRVVATVVVGYVFLLVEWIAATKIWDL